MPLHSALAKLPARLLSWLRFLPRSWISVYILCVRAELSARTKTEEKYISERLHKALEKRVNKITRG